MSNTKIKIMDPTQIKYTPEEGEIIQSSIDKNFYVYKNGNWIKLSMEGSGLSLGLYDLNKSIIEQLPNLKDYTDAYEAIQNLHMSYQNKFYMLYGKEISYFTIFNLSSSNQELSFEEGVIDCLKSIGTIKCIDPTEDKSAIEIWVKDGETTDITCLYLFPYDAGMVHVRG